MSALRRVFLGPNGPRAGWRLVIFVTMLIALYFAARPIIDFAMRKLHAEVFTPWGGFIVFGVFFAALLLASGVMAKIEERGIGDYGLPRRRAFCGQFWPGAPIRELFGAALRLSNGRVQS
jgi:hypothetical protein